MRLVDGLLWKRPDEAIDYLATFAAAIGGQVVEAKDGGGLTFIEWRAKRRVVWRDMDRDAVWVAPSWLAWLYRLLPYDLTWRRGPEYDHARLPAFYLFVVHAPTWLLAWLPAARDPRYGARLGILMLGDRRIVL
jgi:hypothetical protein